MKKKAIALILGSLLVGAGCGSEASTVQSTDLAESEVSSAESNDSAESEGSSEESTQDDNDIEMEDSGETEDTDNSESDEKDDAEEQKQTVSIVMVGDILLHMKVEDSAKDENGKYDFSPVFANLKDEISSADMAMVNQEVIIGGEELVVAGYPCFNAPYEIGDALVDAGFDVVLHATNHALDRGGKGIRNTLAFWKEKHPEISVAGINESAEDREQLCIREVNGIKIAVLNYTYGTNGIALPADMPYAVNMLDKNAIISDLKKAEEEADFTIVCPHWGTELHTDVSEEQKMWTEVFYENGADLIIGAHPHVIEPVELIEDENTSGITNNRGKGEEEQGDMLVYYSLGNFVNWTNSEGNGVSDRMLGGMAEVTIERDSDGSVNISDYGVRALVCHLENGYGGVTVYPLSEYSENLAAGNEIKQQDANFSKEYEINLCNEVWGDDWH